jgi:hypothetical protein
LSCKSSWSGAWPRFWEFENWYGRPVTMATLCTVAAYAVAVEQRRGLDALATWNSAFSLVYDGVAAAPR